MPKQLTQDIIVKLISLVSGTFTTRQIWSELNIITPESKAYLRVCLDRLAESGVIVRTGVDGTFRKIDNEKKTRDGQSGDKARPYRLNYPLESIIYAVFILSQLSSWLAARTRAKLHSF